MITVEPNLPPWRNEIDEDEDAAENELMEEELAAQEAAQPVPVFRWSAKASQDSSTKPVSCRTLVMAFSHANDIIRASCPGLSPTNWVASVFIPGLSARGNRLDLMHPENRSCKVFQVGSPSESTFLILCTYDIPPECLVSWVDIVMAHILPSQVVVLDAISRLVKSYPSPWSHLWPSTERKSHIRSLHTPTWTDKTSTLPPMEVGRPVMGPTAAVLGHCHLRSIPAFALLLFVLPGPSHDLLLTLQPWWSFVKDSTSGAIGLPEEGAAGLACRELMKKVGGVNDDELLYI